jgi:hypothetical protein
MTNVIFFDNLTMSDKGSKVFRNVGNYLLEDLNILGCDAVVIV